MCLHIESKDLFGTRICAIYSYICRKGINRGIILETDLVLRKKDINVDEEFHSEIFDIRRVSETDSELFRDVAAAEYLFGRIYKVDPEIGIKVYWETMIEDNEDINYSVFLKNGDLLGRVALQRMKETNPELAIVIVKKYQGQGYGAVLLKQFLNWVHETMGYGRINVRIDSSNERSKGLFRKIGVIVDEEDDIIYCHLNLPM